MSREKNVDNGQLLPLLGGIALGAVLAGLAVYLWVAKKLKREHERVVHVEQSRQQGAQQLTQARKQVEQLQRENHELRLAVRPVPRPAPAPEVPAVDPAEAARLYAESKLQPAAPAEKPKTFKDTVVMPRSQY
jgi:uncharacterized membrane protein YccC